MAKQVINIGTDANDNTGDPIRDAFDKVNDNFTELYTDDAGDVNSITATAPIVRDSATGAVTISLANAGVTLAKVQNVAANSLLVRDANSSGVLTEKALATTQILIGDGTGMTAAALSGDATMTNAGVVSIGTNKVITDKILDSNVTTSKIADNNITHDKLSNRYTAEVAISTRTGTVAFDFSAGSSFKIAGDLTGAYTINITNYKKGQVATIYPLKAQSVTLTGGSGTGVFNKVAGVDYDNSVTSILQIECVDDQAANPVFFYSVATFAADPTI
jgi:hypothetical protein